MFLLSSIFEFTFAETYYVDSLCIVFGNGSSHNIWSHLSSTFLGLIMSSTSVHTLVVSLIMYKVVYTTVREVQELSSSFNKQYGKNLHGMFKTMVQSITFRLLECVPIVILITVHFSDYSVNDSLQLMAVFLSMTVVSIWKPFTFIWSALLHGHWGPCITVILWIWCYFRLLLLYFQAINSKVDVVPTKGSKDRPCDNCHNRKNKEIAFFHPVNEYEPS